VCEDRLAIDARESEVRASVRESTDGWTGVTVRRWIWGVMAMLSACQDAPPPAPPAPQVAAPITVVETSAPSSHAAAAPIPPLAAPTAPATYAAWGDMARAALERSFFVPERRRWRYCSPDIDCGAHDSDWGADSLTDAMAFRDSLTHDASIVPILAALDAGGPAHDKTCRLPTCKAWSDVPEWDSVTASREYAVTHDPHALRRAVQAFSYVDDSDGFAMGACPGVLYQQPAGGDTKLKTLETDSNYILAALLLHEATHEAAYLAKAVARYAAVRKAFKDPVLPLYTVYVVDSGAACEQIPQRFFASVNGNMIQSGLLLAERTGKAEYRQDAIATAKAVDDKLSDGAGIFEDLQAENDITLPLVLAFYRLSTVEKEDFARQWILRNASAALSTMTAEGSYGRFWGGPRPSGATTAFQVNGAFGLAFAAAALAPTAAPSPSDVFSNAAFVPSQISVLPTKLEFVGRAVALIGDVGETCCESGHARVRVDGVETVDKTGIWQNKSSVGRALPSSVLFAWRFSTSGRHTLEFLPGEPNPKEGTSYLHAEGYLLVP
jgi:hypothetical protein